VEEGEGKKGEKTIMIGKAIAAWGTQFRSRGLLPAILMNVSQLLAFARAFRYRLLYGRSILASVFAMQGGSTIEIFNKRARCRVGRFVFMRKNISIRLDDEGQLTLGDHVFINDNCTINCALRVSIGEYTKIAPNVCINDHDHNFRGDAEGHLLKGEVVIGSNVWIGTGSIILRDTVIGDNAVIAAGSIVKGYVPSDTLFMNKREKHFSAIARASEEEAVRGPAKGAEAI
jgi:acetyltransferase-like isoleucine patch superfamily enzyme